jgi:hypothetical protein
MADVAAKWDERLAAIKRLAESPAVGEAGDPGTGRGGQLPVERSAEGWIAGR